MHYPVTLTPDTDGFCVTFRDIPEAISQGDTTDEALDMAQDALWLPWSFILKITEPYQCQAKHKMASIWLACHRLYG